MKILSVAAAALALLSSCVSAKNANDWDLWLTDSRGTTLSTGGQEQVKQGGKMVGTWMCLRLGPLIPIELHFTQYSKAGGADKEGKLPSCFAYVHSKDACGHDDNDPPGESVSMEISSKIDNGWIHGLKISAVKSVEVECYIPKDDISKYRDRSKHSINAKEKCHYKSHCSKLNSGHCEDHCGDRGFSHMSSIGNCGVLKPFERKCCCITS